MGGAIPKFKTFPQTVAFSNRVIAPSAKRGARADCWTKFDPAMPGKAALLSDAMNVEDGVHSRRRAYARVYRYPQNLPIEVVLAWACSTVATGWPGYPRLPSTHLDVRHRRQPGCATGCRATEAAFQAHTFPYLNGCARLICAGSNATYVPCYFVPIAVSANFSVR